MSGSTIIFYMLAALTLVSAVMSVSTRRIFRAAIFLLFTLIGIAGLYFWMEYEFIAAVQIVVYVGGITVLIIFSIFLTQEAGELLPSHMIPRCAPHSELPTERTVEDRLVVFAGWLVTDGYVKRCVKKLRSGKTVEYRYGRIKQSKPQTVAELRAEYEAQERRFAQE